MSSKSVQKMNNKRNSNKKYMTYQYFINIPMQIVERRLKMITAKNQHLINLLKRRLFNPLNRKFSHVAFNNYVFNIV